MKSAIGISVIFSIPASLAVSNYLLSGSTGNTLAGLFSFLFSRIYFVSEVCYFSFLSILPSVALLAYLVIFLEVSIAMPICSGAGNAKMERFFGKDKNIMREAN